MSCTFGDNDCIIDYQVVLSGKDNTMGSVFVGGERGENLTSVKPQYSGHLWAMKIDHYKEVASL